MLCDCSIRVIKKIKERIWFAVIISFMSIDIGYFVYMRAAKVVYTISMFMW